MDEVLKAVGNFGFPMVISIFLLVRLESRLDRVAESIHELAVAVRCLPIAKEAQHGEKN